MHSDPRAHAAAQATLLHAWVTLTAWLRAQRKNMNTKKTVS